ncbi:hypothetical protein HanPSC8_Chr17g0755681 [Helianthus annuus]|nr:hypothetical protein HanPSC8_Chr17g0755681 [Helianthus annuus]
MILKLPIRSDFPLCLVYQNSYVSTNNYIVNSSTANPVNSNTYSTISSSLTTSLSVKIVHHLLPFNIQNLPYALSLSLSLNTIREVPLIIQVFVQPSPPPFSEQLFLYFHTPPSIVQSSFTRSSFAHSQPV